MSLLDLQGHLRATGRYSGAIDGLWGRLTEAGVLLMLTDGPDTLLNDDDLRNMATRQGLTFAQVKAVTAVESNGAGFFGGRPLILPEPHRFSKATRGRFDKSDPAVSYPNWGARPYPSTQDGRYDVLLHMIRLDVDAGFASASYGRFQIMGENHGSCGYTTSMGFAEAMARDEVHQLLAFETFLIVTGLLGKLRACTADAETCRPFCKGYNGTAYEKNSYHIKLAAAIKRYS